MYKTLMSYDGSPFCKFFFLSFVPPSSKICGTVLQASRPNGEPFVGIVQRITFFLFFPIPRCPAFMFSSPVFGTFFATVSLLWYCKGRPRSSLWSLATFNLSHTMIFIVWLSESCFHFPSVKSQFKWFAPLVRLLTHWDTLVLPGVGLNVNLNTRGANSVTASLHVQAHKEHQSAIRAPALFSLQKEVEPGTGTGAWEKDQRRLLHCVLWGWLLLTLLG